MEKNVQFFCFGRNAYAEKKSCDKGVSTGTVKNCFRKAGFSRGIDEVPEILFDENTVDNIFDDD